MVTTNGRTTIPGPELVHTLHTKEKLSVQERILKVFVDNPDIEWHKDKLFHHKDLHGIKIHNFGYHVHQLCEKSAVVRTRVGHYKLSHAYKSLTEKQDELTDHVRAGTGLTITQTEGTGFYPNATAAESPSTITNVSVEKKTNPHARHVKSIIERMTLLTASFTQSDMEVMNELHELVS